MDKKYYNLLLILIGVGIIFSIYNIGGNANFSVNGLFEITGESGILIILSVIGILLYLQQTKQKDKH